MKAEKGVVSREEGQVVCGPDEGEGRLAWLEGMSWSEDGILSIVQRWLQVNEIITKGYEL